MGKPSLKLIKNEEEDSSAETEERRQEEPKGLIGSLKKKAGDVAKEAFDVCFVNIEKKSHEVLESYEAKTQEFTSDLINNEKEFLKSLDEKLKVHVHEIFGNIEVALDLLMARVLSLLATIALVYMSIQINETLENGLSFPRTAFTFILATALLTCSIRAIRLAWDWHRTIKEFQRWQFMTGLIAACGFVAVAGTQWVLSLLF